MVEAGRAVLRQRSPTRKSAEKSEGRREIIVPEIILAGVETSRKSWAV